MSGVDCVTGASVLPLVLRLDLVVLSLGAGALAAALRQVLDLVALARLPSRFSLQTGAAFTPLS